MRREASRASFLMCPFCVSDLLTAETTRPASGNPSAEGCGKGRSSSRQVSPGAGYEVLHDVLRVPRDAGEEPGRHGVEER